MASSRGVTMALALVAVMLSGCITGEEAEPEARDEAAPAEVTEKTGSVTGQVITESLDLLPGIEVGLVNRTGGVVVTTTDKTAHYTFNDVAPGPYRIQVDVPCCKTTTVAVDVQAGEVAEVNLRIPRLTAEDLVEPYVVQEQWDGFVGCDVSTFSAGLNLCDGIDSNHDTIKRFQIEPGIQELVIGMEWDENTLAPDAYGNALGLHLHNENCETCGYRYVREDKASPIVVFLYDGVIMERDPDNGADQRFSLIEEPRDMRYSVYSGGTNVVYQQAFTLHWFEFYHQRSPLEFSPLPGE